VAPAPYQLHVAGDYAAAAAAWDVLGRPYDAAEVRADSCDDKAWRQALHVFDRFGARPARARLARRMRLNGVRNIPRGPRTSTQSGPHGLTVREHEVLGLVRLGHTDAEIAGRLHVSTKTVGHHVSAVLRKTGTSSRRHLHALAR
jgi:DNA-binding CsgD family transcriptional regulator